MAGGNCPGLTGGSAQARVPQCQRRCTTSQSHYAPPNSTRPLPLPRLQYNNCAPALTAAAGQTCSGTGKVCECQPPNICDATTSKCLVSLVLARLG